MKWPYLLRASVFELELESMLKFITMQILQARRVHDATPY